MSSDVQGPVQNLFFPSTKLSRYLPPAGWAFLIFVLSSIPGYRYPEVKIVQFDKLVHFCLYLPLGVGLARAFSSRMLTVRASRETLLWASLAGSFYGATDELHQLLVPNRSCSVADWVIDVLAVWAGAVLWLAVEKAVRSAGVRNPVPNPGESA